MSRGLVCDVQGSFQPLSGECIGEGVDEVKMLQTPPRGELGYPAPVLAVQVERRTERGTCSGGGTDRE